MLFSRLILIVISVLTTISQVNAAGAAARTLSATTAHTSNPANFGGTFHSGDWAVLTGVNYNIIIDNAINLSGVNMNGELQPGSITATSNGATLGSVGNQQVGQAGTMSLIVNDGILLTLSGTRTEDDIVKADDYTGLSAIVIGSSVDGAAGTTLTINGVGGGMPTLYATIDSYAGATGNFGTLNVFATYLLEGAVGSNTKLAVMNIGNGATVGFSCLNADSINIAESDSILQTWGGEIHGNIFNTSGLIGNTALNIKGDTTLYGSVGTSTSSLSKIYFETDDALVIDAAADRFIYAPVITGANGTGSLQAGGGNTTFAYDIGATKYLKAVTFGGIIGDSVSSTKVKFDGASSIRAQNINHNNATLSAANDLSITAVAGGAGYVIQDNAAFDIGSNKITVTGNITLADNVTVNAVYNGNNQVALDLSGATVTWTPGTILTFNVTNSAPTNTVITMVKLPTAAFNTYGYVTVVSTNRNWGVSTLGTLYYLPPASNVSVGGVQFSLDSGGVTSISQVPGEEIDRQAFLSQLNDMYNTNADVVLDPASVALIAQINPGNLAPSTALSILQGANIYGIRPSFLNLAAELMITDPAQFNNMSIRIDPASPASSRVTAVNAAMDDALDNIGTRLGSTTGLLTADALAAGVAAGDGVYDRFGVWGSINGGSATQKLRNGNPGFRSFSRGASIGVDTMLDERNSIGFAASSSVNNVKYKDAKAGDKTDSTSWIAAAYGNHKIGKSWFVRGTALATLTRINSKDLRVIGINQYGVATSKYNMLSYGADVSVGFAHMFRNHVVMTPTVGFRVSRNGKVSCQEKGTTGQNNRISQDPMNSYSVLAGLQFAKTFEKDGILFTPDIHATLQHGFDIRSPTGSYVSEITPLLTTRFVGTKASKISSSYGFGFTGSSDRIECGITGDVSVARKYLGYQGSVKLKVKF